MYFGVNYIDAAALNTRQISQPGYLGSVKRELMERHALELQLLCEEPEFLIAQVNERGQEKDPSAPPPTRMQATHPAASKR